MKFSWKINLIVAGFFISFLTDGIFYSFAVLFPGLLKDFKKGESDTAWVASLSRGFIQLIGLVVGPLTKQFGCTAVAIVGSLLASTALFLSAFATEILYLDFSYGILGGCAAGFCIHPAVIATTINFSKHRGLAVGLVTAGTGCGIFAFAPFMNVIVDAYNWQASLMICGGIILNVTILALFLRPFNPFRCCCKLVPGRDPSLQPVNPCRCCVKAKPSENITPEAAPEQQSFVESQPLASMKSESIASRENIKKTCCGKFYDNTHTFCNFCKELLFFFCNWRLLLDSRFVFVCLGGAFVSLGLFVPTIFIYQYAISLNISKDKAAVLQALMGVTNMISRVVLGYLSDQPWSNVLSVFILGTLLGGASTIPLGYLNEYVPLAIYSCAFGICLGSVLSLRSSVVYELMGVECFHQAFGMYLLFTGIFALIGSPLFGFVYETTGRDYKITFISTGIVILVGMMFLVLIPATDFCWRKIQKFRGKPIARPEETPTSIEL